MLRGVIFDRDGVLCEFDKDLAQKMLCPSLPISIEQLGVQWQQWEKNNLIPHNLTEEQEYWTGFWDKISNDFNLSVEARRQLKHFDYTQIIRVFPDVPPILSELKALGLKIGVLSNFGLASLHGSLSAVGLLDFIDAACTAAVIGVRKPHPTAYLKILDALALEPQECLLFDDKIACVEGARAVGIRAYLVDRTQNQHQLSNDIICNLSYISKILLSLRA